MKKEKSDPFRIQVVESKKKRGHFFWRLVARNNEVVASSEMFSKGYYGALRSACRVARALGVEVAV